MNVLALSSSRTGNGAYLEAAVPMIGDFLQKDSLRVAFVPFAAVDNDVDGYTGKVKEGLASLALNIETVTPENASSLINDCDVIMVGGGNTFKLLHDIYDLDIYARIVQRVTNGTPYIGWSAGSNLTGLTISTTNDMPIIQPRSFLAFGFLPFQLNPHYHNALLEGFNGETRDQRLVEFLQLNVGIPVVGLPEGTALQLKDGRLKLLGERHAVLFQNSKDDPRVVKMDLLPDADLSFLLG